MLQFPGGQQATTDQFPNLPGTIGSTSGAVLGPSHFGTGVLINVFNNPIDLQGYIRDRSAPRSFKPTQVLANFPTVSQVFPEWIGFQARSHNAGLPAQLIAQVWEVDDGPLPLSPLLNLGTLSNVGTITPPGVSSGMIVAWPVASPPSGAVLCDGTVYNSVTDTSFAALFAVIGTQFGGSGASSFAVPDLRGRVITGSWPGGIALGSNDGAVPANRSIVHNSSIHDPGHSHGYSDPQHVHYEIGWQRTVEGAGTIAPFQGTMMDTQGTGTNIQVSQTTQYSPTNITISGSGTGITSGPGGSYPTDAPSWMGLAWIIFK